MAPSILYSQPELKEDEFASILPYESCFEPDDSEVFEEQRPEGHLVYQSKGLPKQSRIDGEFWPPIFLPKSVRGAKAMQPRNDDVFVCTYPKCGTTWVQHICAQLLFDDYGPEVGAGAIPELSKTSPMIERMGAEFADTLPSPRILKTHFAWYNLPKNPKAKYIFCVRNPKDCLTSYFFHNQNFKIYNFEDGDFDKFFELFMSDKIAFGNYYWHLLSWLPHVNDENVLFLRYEDMCEDMREAIKKIGNFLGGRAADIVNNEEMLDRVVLESKIDSMKKDQGRWFPEDNLRGLPFIRKGGSRDWKNYFTRSQSDRIDAQWRREVAGTIAENWWKPEMDWNEPEDDEGIMEDFGSTSEADVTRKQSQPICFSLKCPGQELLSKSSDSAFGSFDDRYFCSQK